MGMKGTQTSQKQVALEAMAVFVGPSFCTPKRRAGLQNTTAACISAYLRKRKGGQPAPADAHSGITQPVAGRFEGQGLKGGRLPLSRVRSAVVQSATIGG
jgi:hypothetical protein